MSKRRVFSKQEKLRIVKQCQAGKMGVCEVGRRIGANQESIRNWIRLYQAEGEDGLGAVKGRPLLHSDRGFQYTNRTFYNKLKKAKMKQSMSRVAKCIDNGPMEGFWGILKRERYYGRRFTSREELVQMIEEYHLSQ